MEQNHFEPFYVLMVHGYPRFFRISPEILPPYPWYYHNRTKDSFPFYLLYAFSEMCFIVFSHIARFNYFLLFTFETSPGTDFLNSIYLIVVNHSSFNYIRLCNIFRMSRREMIN